jgi:hypothetical protein
MDQPRSMDLSLRNTDSRHLMPILVVTRALSEALIMEELREGFPLADNRASAAEVSTAVRAEAFTVVGATGNSVSLIENNLRSWRTQSCTQQI